MFPGGVGAGARDERVADDLVELLTVTQRRVAAGVAAALAEDGGTLDGYRVLRALAGGGRAMGELVAALHLPAPTCTRLVDAAVDQALAYRLPHPDDGRKVVVHLSEPGRDRLRRWESLVQAHEAALAGSLGPDRVAALRQALSRLADQDG
ncbi:MarR family winged helix-turn-helix transcriptional regulator [Blastococcus xanthinilyticus]|uniref:DNA-binding MarR family transcriptional regulator n=1 Tax=Blastococcus xanthinilyticus TaxID=1564164 RepID=A0A5S5CZX6_9ACTN|nr:MarR family transcriptional regulator [Blastococcus xanthinilyticus]TYP88568.1 DNA-binding MarR family transcriptional regulator [Blastococcus xanthinilyticus]